MSIARVISADAKLAFKDLDANPQDSFAAGKQRNHFLGEQTMYYVELPSGTILETDDPARWPEAKRLSARVGKAALREGALTELRAMLKPGDTINCILRNVSRSGMSRQIDFYAGECCITRFIARALDYPRARNGALRVGGCGMDMGFLVVYNLGAALWPNGTPAPHGRRNGEPDRSGGYALRHRWL